MNKITPWLFNEYLTDHLKEKSFPVYRKYHNNSSYFKVLSEEEFEEVKKLPGGPALFRFKAKILPDRNYIYDMLYDYHLHWLEIDEIEYEGVKAQLLS